MFIAISAVDVGMGRWPLRTTWLKALLGPRNVRRPAGTGTNKGTLRRCGPIRAPVWKYSGDMDQSDLS
eukprot:1402523-Pyramimonas_sp.AAC.1